MLQILIHQSLFLKFVTYHVNIPEAFKIKLIGEEKLLDIFGEDFQFQNKLVFDSNHTLLMRE